MEKTRTEEVRTLAQTVSSWQPSKLPQIADEFSKSCKSSLLSFSGYDAYKAYFEPLLFAELAAECTAAVEKFSRSPAVRPSKIRSRREEPGTVLVRVNVKKVLPIKNPCKFAVDLDPVDDRGPVGCNDGDVIAVWRAEGNVATIKTIPPKAVMATVIRPVGKLGVRVALDNFPDGDAISGQDLEEGEEVENIVNTQRHWFLLRLGSVITLRREHEAVLNIKTSPLLAALLRPSDDSSSKNGQPGLKEIASSGNALPARFTHIVKGSMGLNPAQVRAVEQGSNSTGGFTVVQGPPGTGKTRTLIALLNVIHTSQYQEYYETIVSSVKHNYQKNAQGELIAGRRPPTKRDRKVGESLLESLIAVMHKTNSTIQGEFDAKVGMRTRRPRLLVCAPSNSAVDEVLTRLLKIRFLDGQGERYIPEVVRVGNGDRVADGVKRQLAERQAEMFLNEWCNENITPEEQRKQQFKELSNWQCIANKLLENLRRLPKREDNCDLIVKLHEQLERMERNLRRLGIAGSTKLTRDEKLRSIARTIVEDAQIVFSTLSGAASKILMPRGMTWDKKEASLFDTVIIDEAAQSTEPSCLVPLMLGAERCLLVGDPQQLPATVLSAGNAGAAYGQSLLDRICRAGKKMLLLDTQYRMHPAISSFPRRHFYGGKLVDDASVQDENRSKPCHHDQSKPRLGPYVFLDVTDGEEKRSFNDRSIFNEAEAELAVKIYKKLKSDYSNDVIFSPEGRAPGSSKGFGVVTPYKSQMQILRRTFDLAGVSTGDIEIDTVDSYQGREKDVVIFSCVRSSVTRGIGFVRDVRRMNVGLTRARSSLIILGNAQALSEGSEDWCALVEDARSRGCLIPVTDVNAIFHGPETVTSDEAPVPTDPRIRKTRAQVPAVTGPNQIADKTFYQSQRNVTTNGEHGEVVDPSTDSLAPISESEIEAQVNYFLQAAESSNVPINSSTIAEVRRQVVKSNGHIDIETLLAVLVTTTNGRAFAQGPPHSAAVGNNGASKISLRSAPVPNPVSNNVKVEHEDEGKPRRTGRPTVVKSEGAPEATGWAMALGGTNNEKKRASREMIEGSRQSKDSRSEGRGTGNFGEEVRPTPKRTRHSTGEGLHGQQRDQYNQFNDQQNRVMGRMGQVGAHQAPYMGETGGQMAPGMMVGGAPVPPGYPPGYGQPMPVAYGAPGGPGLGGVTHHQLYMQQALQNQGAMPGYGAGLIYPQQMPQAPHMMPPPGFIPTPNMFPQGAPMGTPYVPMVPAQGMGNEQSWGSGLQREVGRGGRDPRGHRGRGRGYRRGSHNQPR